MKKYKHYSFDLWKTLIKSHPDYKEARSQYFYAGFNASNRTQEEVFDIIRQAELKIDWVNEHSGKSITPDEILCMILHDLGVREIGKDVLKIMKLDLRDILRNNMPKLCSSDIPYVLDQLYSRGTLSITSNTAFIPGDDLDRVLNHPGIKRFFKFCLYSDRIGCSKPHPDIFEHVVNLSGVPRDYILHIGDSMVSDIDGAEKAGLDAFHIDSNYEFKYLLNF